MTETCPKCKSPIARQEQRFCYRCGFELRPQNSQEVLAQPAPPDPSPYPPVHHADSSQVPAGQVTPGQQTVVINSPQVPASPSLPESSVQHSATLRVLLPSGDLFDREVNKSETQVGKGPRNDIVIADPAVSTSHAMIRAEGEGFIIADIGSRNGTFVNGEKLSGPRKLEHGDVIGIGLSKLTFRLKDHSETKVFDVSNLAFSPMAPLPLTEDSLASALINEGLVSKADVDRLRAQDARGRRLCRALIEERKIDEERLRDLMCRIFQLPSIDLKTAHVDENLAVGFPSRIARDHSIFAFRKEGDQLLLAVLDPTDKEGIEKARLETRTAVKVMIATAGTLSDQIEKYYGPKLIGVLPSGEKLRFLITNQPEIGIGKATHNQIVLSDPTVSNSHAVIMVRDGGYSIVDLGSRNGTFVNGERLSAHARTLLHGDSIQLGQTTLTFRNSGQTTENVTATLSPSVLQEILKRANLPDLAPAQPGAMQPAQAGAIALAQPVELRQAVAQGDVSAAADEDEDEKKKKKKKKDKEDERLKAAKIGAYSRIVAQITSALLTATLTAVGIWWASRPPAPSPSTQGTGSTTTNVRQGEKLANAGPEMPISGGTFEASGAVHVPDSDGVLFVDDAKPGKVFWVQLDESGKQIGDSKSVQLGASVENPEGITYGNSSLFIVGSQSDPAKGEKNSIARFGFDTSTQTVRDQPEVITDFRSFLIENVPELKGEGEKPGVQGGLNVEGIAWDPTQERLLLGLRQPFLGGDALIVPLKLRDPRSFTKESLTVSGSGIIRLSLGGQGIRDIQYDTKLKSFLIISGEPETRKKGVFKLWLWDGGSGSQPSEVASLNPDMKPEGVTHVSISGTEYVVVFGDASRFMKIDYAQ